MISSRLIPNKLPTDIVTYLIKVNQAEIPRTFGVLSIQVWQEINRIPTARIELLDGSAPLQDFPISNEDIFVPGNEIEILLGYHAQEISVFTGIVTSQRIKIRRSGATLFIECKDSAVKMTIGRKNRYFFEQTDSDVIQSIIEENELTADISSPTEIQHAELVQFDTTDWDFIVSRAEANGRICLLNGGTLQLPVPEVAEPALDVQFGSPSLEEFDAEMDARWQYTSVAATSWDAAGQEVIQADAAEPGQQEAGNLTTSDLASGIGAAPYTLYHSGRVAQDELQTWADAQLLKSRLSKIRGRVKFQGYAELKTGDTLQLTGVGERMSGPVYISGIRHEFASGNWYTDAQFGLDPAFFSRSTEVHAPRAGGLLGAVSGLQIGIVTQLADDPEGEERIRVKLPIVSPAEDGVWTRLALPDAGENRGLIFRPEIDDEVIVGFINDDPRDPVVLGMLHSSAKPAPSDLAANDDNHEKGIITRSELKCLFNDDVKSIAFETPAGNKLLISEDEQGIVLEDQNGNKLTLNADGIALESAKDIVLKTSAGDVKVDGLNIEHKAQAQFKAEGTSGLEVKSSAVAILKGSLVQIN